MNSNQSLGQEGNMGDKGVEHDKEYLETPKVGAKKRVLPPLFWVAAASLAMIVVIKLIGLYRHPHGLIVTPPKPYVQEPTPEEVVALQKKRQQELERQKLELEKKKLLADIELRVQKYRSDVAAMVEKWRKMLPLSEAEVFFQKSEEGARAISSKEGLCGFRCCVSLAYKMAYDKIKGTTRAEDAVSPIVQEKVVDDIERAINVYSKWTADFHKELAAEEMALAADLAVKCNKFQSAIEIISEESVNDVEKAMRTFVGDIQTHAAEAAFSAVGLTAEVVMIKSSYSAIKKGVVALAGTALSGAVARVGASATAGGAAAAVDGPLPIGDAVGAIITIAGLSWSAYDIYNVTLKMPAEMNAKIQDSILQTRKALKQTALVNLQKAKERSDLFAEQALSDVTKILNENEE